VLCPVCNTTNADGSLACKSCGAPLTGSTPSTTTHSLQPGTKLQGGSFSIGKVLGQGGFGITYLGSDTRLRRAVAIKECFLFEGCSRHDGTVQVGGSLTVADFQKAKRGFLDEAQMLARFHHPSIVQVHTSFEENNTAYMVMELLSGKDLEKLLEQRGAIPEREAVGYIHRVGEALEVVHQASVLHRDIKPANIRVTDDGRVVLMDFGTARQFATGKTRQMTVMLTLDFAPLEQFLENAQFGPPTDLYALGATLYYLVTGSLPARAVDRKAGQALAPPHRLNSQVSQVVNDAVMWAMEMQMAKRPQSAREFLQALAGGPNPNRNPYEGQIRQILADLAKPLPAQPTSSAHDRRINEINRCLAVLDRLPLRKAGSCPACDQAVLVHITGEYTGRCPLCGRGDLTGRQIESNLCPVCRDGELGEYQSSKRAVRCPLCRRANLKSDARTLLIFFKEVWWVCPDCQAQFRATDGRTGATLMEFHEDPYGVGQQYRGQTLLAEHWQRLAGPREHYWKCKQCSARLDSLDDGRLKLIVFISDPYGVGMQFCGKTLLRSAWGKLALGLPLTAGNCFCPDCRAEFNLDSSQQTLAMLDLGSGNSRWGETWRGQAWPVSTWYIAAHGKSSLRPGWLCSACRAEFDDDPAGLKAIKLPSGPLSALVKQVYSLSDWYRRASGAPTLMEEKQLREECASLASLKQQEQSVELMAQRQSREMLEEELTRLLKQAMVEGFSPLQLQSHRISLREDEILYLEAPGLKLKQRTTQGNTFWETEIEGTLFVTSERILVDSPNGKMWQRPISKLIRVEKQYLPGFISKASILVSWFDGLQKPVGFSVPGLQLSVIAGNQTRTIKIDTNDLERMIQMIAKKAR
jgi:serine/threonine protein kinase